MPLAFVDAEYWWTPLATDALTRVGAAASLPVGNKWTAAHSKATKKFQQIAKLTQDGDPGPNTVRELRAKVGAIASSDKIAAQAFVEVLRNAANCLVFVASTKGTDWFSKYAGELVEITNDFDNAWDDKVPEVTRSMFFSQMSDTQKAEWKKFWLKETTSKKSKIAKVGAVPVLFAPFVISAGWTVTGAALTAAAEATVAAVGAGVALASAAWLAERLNGWIVKAVPSAPENVTGEIVVKITSPAHLAGVGSPPPPIFTFKFKDLNIKKMLKGIGTGLVLTLAWLIGGIGTVASLFGPLVTAAAGAVGGLFWLLLAAAAAFFAARRKGR